MTKAPSSRPSRPTIWHRLSRNGLAATGMLIVLAIALTAFAAPILPLADPNVTAPANRLQPLFSGSALLGTDQLGRDILARLIWGTRVSLAVGLAATLIAALIGSTIGLIAAYFGGLIDQVLMRAIDMLMAFPYLLLALAIVAALGPSLMNALLAISVVNIPFFARSVRGATISLVQREFIEAAHLSGFSSFRILTSELLPNVLPVIIITMSTTFGWMILETAGLSFLGLGAQPPQADLGSMLGDGRRVVVVAPHIAAAPGLLILVLVIGLNLLGDGLRDILDPRLKSGALSRPVAMTDRKPSSVRTAGLTSAPAAASTHHTAQTSAEDHHSPDLLTIRGLETQFHVGRDIYRAVNRVDLTLRRGESLGIVGESGSGKSVTALSVLGLVATPPGTIVGGEIRFEGTDLLSLGLRELQDIRGSRIAYIFQDPLTTLNPLLSIGDQVAETLVRHQSLSVRAAWKEAVTLLGRVQLPDPEAKARAFPHQLSGGQRQRVVIAMALANAPDVIIADEPTTALDVTTQARVLGLLDELRRETGAALIFITHDLGVVSQICERVLVMYAGQVVETGPVRDVFPAPRHPYTERLLASVPILGRADRALDAIPGLPPAVNRLPPGCAFAERCPMALAACRQSDIPLELIGPERASRCIRHGELAHG